jgi:hypothetical protein
VLFSYLLGRVCDVLSITYLLMVVGQGIDLVPSAVGLAGKWAPEDLDCALGVAQRFAATLTCWLELRTMCNSDVLAGATTHANRRVGQWRAGTVARRRAWDGRARR